MSYPKKNTLSEKSAVGANSKLTQEKRDRLLAIQQREQLKGMIVSKFIEKYGKIQGAQQAIDKEVSEFIRNEKVTEENLKKLEQRIKQKTQQKQQQNLQQALPSIQNNNNDDNKSVKSGISTLSKKSQGEKKSQILQKNNDDAISQASSKAPKSIYHLGDEEDEWSMIMKFDQELFKKEQELEKMRLAEQKKKIKSELDRQLGEKNVLKNRENNELEQYNEMQIKKLELYDEREKAKEDEKKNKILQEKLSRDKQLQEEANRKKLEKKRQKELDDLLVQRIQEELQKEQQLLLQRKMEEKAHLQKVLRENEINKAKQAEEMKLEREADIRAQQEYTRLIEKQEAEREAEIRKREEKAKKFMALMSDTVIKDQKAQIQDEENKILKHYQDREIKELVEEQDKKQKLNQQKKEIKGFLDKQVQEKKIKQQQEQELSNKQAEFWKRDTQDFIDNEKRKQDYIRDINKKHAEILKQQMSENSLKKKGPHKNTNQVKMNVDELLQNKKILKEIAQKNLIGGEIAVTGNKIARELVQSRN